MTEREINEVKKMWQQGMSARQIARVFPQKEYITIREIAELKKQGVLPPINIKETRNRVITKEFEKNKNLMEIANKFGLEITYVRNVLHRNGVKFPKTMNYVRKPKNEKHQAIMRDLENGVPQCEIAKKHGVSRQYVHQILKGAR